MTQQETAMKLASASSKCEKHKCPFVSQCKGDYTSCSMKEVALMLRSNMAEIETLHRVIQGLSEILSSVHEYTRDIEKINKRYHDMIVAFGHGYRPPKPHKIRRLYQSKIMKRKTPEERDGDPRFAYEEEKKESPPPMVVI